uniref:Guanylate kinase-like domain-containing protein n=1 Tax=Mesocestoides corti TaxID=53468 RepID=A0A5K3FX80_MESCO
MCGVCASEFTPRVYACRFCRQVRIATEVPDAEDDDFRRTLECSQDIERNYRHVIDKIVICDNIEVTFVRLKELLDGLLEKPQWVPAKLLY